jgi:hypothetical protein
MSLSRWPRSRLSKPVCLERGRQQPHRRDGFDHRFKELSKDVAVTEAAVAIDRERRVMEYLIGSMESSFALHREGCFNTIGQTAKIS